MEWIPKKVNKLYNNLIFMINIQQKNEIAIATGMFVISSYAYFLLSHSEREKMVMHKTNFMALSFRLPLNKGILAIFSKQFVSAQQIPHISVGKQTRKRSAFASESPNKMRGAKIRQPTQARANFRHPARHKGRKKMKQVARETYHHVGLSVGVLKNHANPMASMVMREMMCLN